MDLNKWTDLHVPKVKKEEEVYTPVPKIQPPTNTKEKGKDGALSARKTASATTKKRNPANKPLVNSQASPTPPTPQTKSTPTGKSPVPSRERTSEQL